MTTRTAKGQALGAASTRFPCGFAMTAISMLGAPSQALAQEAAQQSFVAELWRTGLVLLIVIGMLLASLWLVKRFKFIPQHGAGGKVLQVLAVGTQERVVLLQIQHREYLIGVTSRQITLLDQWPAKNHSLDETELSVTNINDIATPQIKV